jgi:adenosylhomocysteine nucleosidase
MDHGVIGLIAAMPEEINPLLKRVGAYTRETIEGFAAWRFESSFRKIHVIRSGMGPENAANATRALIATTSPDLIINFGFAGAVTKGACVGDIAIAERILVNRKRQFQEQLGMLSDKAKVLVGILEVPFRCSEFNIRLGTFITAAEIKSKREIAELLPAGVVNPVLEMETAAVAETAREGNVPLIAIRAISDSADEELEFSIGEFTDREMNIRLGKVLMTVAKRPWIVPQLLRLARNSRLAGKSLATALPVLLKAL